MYASKHDLLRGYHHITIKATILDTHPNPYPRSTCPNTTNLTRTYSDIDRPTAPLPTRAKA
ncbi:hypothetical protein ASPWEDRAFT_35351 [Aspergillus wentii DTO 134E9]|uniref:Uncharacterized protein n=1 Tax=Aspergillus wentii DTO 134E9 TaxID=1073089 RepID=A0A1L9S3L9_ASPWE|nr:uncharacterized protein ASPWEDRAFT_35351 [Aspergillus wentii DTO 134E9]OJJ41746.1 hypothetical protein ASPWEDRAFT_35351 [Aspergillus wentii DTO 134E9]